MLPNETRVSCGANEKCSHQ